MFGNVSASGFNLILLNFCNKPVYRFFIQKKFIHYYQYHHLVTNPFLSDTGVVMP